MKIDPTPDQVPPTEFEIEIIAFRPFAGLKQNYLTGIRLGLVTVERGVNNGVGIVHFTRPCAIGLL